MRERKRETGKFNREIAIGREERLRQTEAESKSQSRMGEERARGKKQTILETAKGRKSVQNIWQLH